MISRTLLSVGHILKKTNGKLYFFKINEIRKSHVVSYRSPPPPHSRSTRIGAEVVGAAMWWWVLWHLWHEHEHITGEFDYPNPLKWTNKELGIPSDK